MAKNSAKVEGLEEAVVEGITTKSKKVQTPEDAAMLQAGIDKLKELGVSDKLALVLDHLVVVWKSGDQDAIKAAKEAVIEAFGGSEALKDFIDGDFQNELEAYFGISKITPILNNIKSFYARRKTSKRKKMVILNIGGVMYNVNEAYLTSLEGKDKEEKRELVLSHEDTTEAANSIEEL